MEGMCVVCVCVCVWCARVHLCVLACVASMCLLAAESKRGV